MTATRVLCLPYAGGGISSFAPLRAMVSPDLDFHPVRLPGREARYGEPPIRSWAGMDDLLSREVLPSVSETTAIYGHSMGALIGYRLCLLAERRGIRPRALCVAAHRCPAAPMEHETARLDDRELLAYLAELTGAKVAPAIADELLPIVAPAIRADLELCAAFCADREELLATPILAMCGVSDHDVTPRHMASWRAWTRERFALQTVDGDHFFIKTHPAEVIGHLSAFLRTAASGKDTESGERQITGQGGGL